MQSFAGDRLLRLRLPMGVVRLIAAINEAKGRQDLYRQQRPELLESLRQVAVIQSTESSNRIENVVIDPRRFRDLMADRTTPQNRPENEIAGYRYVLNTIHGSAAYIRVRPNTILQFQRDLYRYTAGDSGHWKRADNTIQATLPNGTRVTRFVPVPAWQTAEAMERLCAEFNRAWDQGQVDHLVLLAAFILDFLCIHPFADGNGRMARLLTLLVLYLGGYEVGRFVSLERVIEESKESYYEALLASSQGWHDGEHDLMPWLEYLLGTILAAYREFADRCNEIETTHGAKTDLVRDTVRRVHQPFTMQDLQHACPDVSLATIRRVLNELKRDGSIQCIELGRNAKWVRI